MTKFFADFLRDESGAAAAEYVIIVGVMGALVAGGALLFGQQLSTAFNNAGGKAVNCSTSTDGTC